MPFVIVKSPVVAPVNVPVPTTNSSALSSKPIKIFALLPLSPTIPISPDGVPVVPVDNSMSLSSMTELVVDSVVVEPFTVKLPVTVRLPPIVGLSTKPTVTVPELSATVVSFAVAAKVNVPPSDTAVVLEPSETVID